ncbi:MAG: amidohydrolase [Kiritimatiellae bacterium]|nr:amidohydrolase [Kiritimatiellia bacterium]
MPHSLLIKNAKLNGTPTDALIVNGVFQTIASNISAADGIPAIDAGGMVLAPAFYNGHTHAAMTLLRGYADDMELFSWLHDCIWPAEAKLDSDLVYHGTRLAILEMIKTGTVFFNDMYWLAPATIRAVDEMGARAAIGRIFTDGSDGKLRADMLENAKQSEAELDACGGTGRIRLTYAPHAVYTVSPKSLEWIAEQARHDCATVHIHASETAKEVSDCITANGCTPIALLARCGILGDKTILAHGVHLNDDDIKLIRESGATIVHNPCSNYKLCSGQFHYRKVKELGGCRVVLGTDGNASNNNLSMFDEMKLAALSAKLESGDPSCAPAADVWRMATADAAAAFGIKGGVIAEGYVGDALLLDNYAVQMCPEYNLAANVVYSCDTSCVDTVICDGRVLMRHRRVEHETEIIAAAQEAAHRFTASSKHTY